MSDPLRELVDFMNFALRTQNIHQILISFLLLVQAVYAYLFIKHMRRLEALEEEAE